RKGAAMVWPLTSIRIVPCCSTMNKRPLPSPALAMSTGEAKPAAMRTLVTAGASVAAADSASAAMQRISRRFSLALERIADLAQKHDFFRRRRLRLRGFLALQPVDLLHHQKDDEREDHEIDRDGDVIAVREERHAGL